MSNCPVSESIAINCDEKESLPCWCCEEAITEDDESHEIKTSDCGYQHVCTDCLDEHFTEGL